MSIARPVDRRLFLLLDRARHKLFKQANNELIDRLGISVTQAGALFYLKRHRDCLLSDLAEGLALNNSAITGLASRMQRAGLLTRTKSQLDGRAMVVNLTDQGKHLAEQAGQHLRHFNNEISSGFSTQEMDIVYRFLSSVAEVEQLT